MFIVLKHWFWVILWAGLIFILSSIPRLESGLDQDFLLRKLAHIFEYFVLTWFLYSAFSGHYLEANNRTCFANASSRDACPFRVGTRSDDTGVVDTTSRMSDAVSGAEWPHPFGFWRFSSIVSLLRVAVGKTTASLSRLALKENRSERGLEASIEIGSDSYFYETPAELGIEFIEIKNLQRSVNFALDAKLLFELIKIIRKEKPDVVHLNSSKIGV